MSWISFNASPITGSRWSIDEAWQALAVPFARFHLWWRETRKRWKGMHHLGNNSSCIWEIQRKEYANCGSACVLLSTLDSLKVQMISLDLVISHAKYNVRVRRASLWLNYRDLPSPVVGGPTELKMRHRLHCNRGGSSEMAVFSASVSLLCPKPGP